MVIEEKKPVHAIAPSPEAQPIAVFADDTTINGKQFLPLHSTQRVFSIITYDDYYKGQLCM